MRNYPDTLVRRFYSEVWNQADEAVAKEILHAKFKFRGSLGPEKMGPNGFIDYMRSVHEALGNYTCILDHLVTTSDEAVARMIFRGIHQAQFFGVPATGQTIEWMGAAFFKTDGAQITSLWVLGDVDSVKAQLGATIKSQV